MPLPQKALMDDHPSGSLNASDPELNRLGSSNAQGLRLVLRCELDGRKDPVQCLPAGKIVEDLNVVEHVGPASHPACGWPLSNSASA